MNRFAWCLLGLLLVSLGFNGWSYYKVDRMTTVVGLLEAKDSLQQQQMNDFTMIMYQKTNENVVEVARQQGKIEGMLAVMSGQKPDSSETSQIWHAGYYRGLDQAKDMKEADGTIKVADDKNKKK